MKYEEVKIFLKEFRKDDPPYDPVGAMYLLKSIIENLNKNVIEDDFSEITGILNNKDKSLLKKLIAI